MTDPSPDCGYTPEEHAQMDAVDANPGPNCVTAWQEEPTPPYPPRPQSRVERLAAALAFYADEANYAATLEDAARGRELRVVDDGGHRARAALAAFASGEHYSGAAQDAWDRIVVLEKRVAEAEKVVEVAREVIRREGLHGHANDETYWQTQKPFWIYNLRAALAAGSASPGGDETLTHGRHCPCTACANEDWTRAGIAPCGMHGPDCPNVYAPAAAPVSTETAPT